MRSNNSNV